MARRRTVQELQDALQAAQAREAALRNRRRTRPTGAVRRRAKSAARYISLFGGDALTIQTPEAGVQFFGGNENALVTLGLAAPGTDPSPSKGFQPNTIHAMVADANPERETSRLTRRSYIRYARGARGSGVQSNFSCAFQGNGSSPTAALAATKYRELANRVRNNIGGDYGRIWVKWEQMPLATDDTGFTVSGGGTGGGTTP